VPLTVVATGNHYIFDVVAGLIVSLVGYMIARLLANRRGAWTIEHCRSGPPVCRAHASA
jgi:membrane-associated phospholipid phosphatase